MNEKTRQALTSGFFEAFFVVLGVVLALAANEWRQQRAERRLAEEALGSIHDELASNRAAVRESYAYHGELVQKIATARQESRTLTTRDFRGGFNHPARVVRTAWEVASDTGAVSHMDYPAVLALSAVYAQQDRYEQQGRISGGIIYEEMFRNGTSALAANALGLSTLIHASRYHERELLRLYDGVLGSDQEESGQDDSDRDLSDRFPSDRDRAGAGEPAGKS